MADRLSLYENLPLLGPEYSAAFETKRRTMEDLLADWQKGQRVDLLSRGVSEPTIQMAFQPQQENVMNQLSSYIADLVMGQMGRRQQVGDIQRGMKFTTGEREATQRFTGGQAARGRELQRWQTGEQLGFQRERMGWEEQMIREAWERQQRMKAEAESRSKQGFWQGMIPSGISSIASVLMPNLFPGMSTAERGITGLAMGPTGFGYMAGQNIGQQYQTDLWAQLSNMFQPQPRWQQALSSWQRGGAGRFAMGV